MVPAVRERGGRRRGRPKMAAPRPPTLDPAPEDVGFEEMLTTLDSEVAENMRRAFHKRVEEEVAARVQPGRESAVMGSGVHEGQGQRDEHPNEPEEPKPRQAEEHAQQQMGEARRRGEHRPEWNMEEFVQKVVEHMQRREGARPEPPQHMARTSPLTADILSTILPDRFVFPQVNKYDGKTDPQDHLEDCIISLHGRTLDDKAVCLLFPSTLTGVARDWWRELPPGSIASLAELKEKFL